MKLDMEQFKQTVKKEEILYLATSASDEVTIRPVSPLMIDDRTILFYTAHTSRKYAQMKANPRAAFVIGPYGAYQGEGSVRFLGSIFSDENAAIREAYKEKYTGAFENPAPGEVMELNEFIALDLTRVKGWIFENGEPVGEAEEKF